jgi:hypothetical protein
MQQLRLLRARRMPQAAQQSDAHPVGVCMQRPHPAPGAQMKFRKGSPAWKLKRGLYYTAAFLCSCGALALCLYTWEAIQVRYPMHARLLAGAAVLVFVSLFFSFFAEEER